MRALCCQGALISRDSCHSISDRRQSTGCKTGTYIGLPDWACLPARQVPDRGLSGTLNNQPRAVTQGPRLVPALFPGPAACPFAYATSLKSLATGWCGIQAAPGGQLPFKRVGTGKIGESRAKTLYIRIDMVVRFRFRRWPCGWHV